MPERPRIALLVESSRDYGRGLLQGIAAYARAHGPWSLYHLERSLGDPAPSRLKEWARDGIIARIESRQLLSQVCQLGLPTVDLLGLHSMEGVPVVRPDDVQTARLALEHLWTRGFRRFAYCGFAGVYYSDLRQQHFVGQVKSAGSHGSIRKPSTATSESFARGPCWPRTTIRSVCRPAVGISLRYTHTPQISSAE